MRHINNVSSRPVLGPLVASLGWLMACGSADGGESGDGRAMALTELGGVWRQRGYARLIEVSGDAVRFYDVTRVSCVPSGELSLDRAQAEYDRITGSENQFSWYETGAFTRYEFERDAALPAACAGTATAATDTFESLWHAFDENYAYFTERGVNWEGVYSAHRPRVTNGTTDQELIQTSRTC